MTDATYALLVPFQCRRVLIGLRRYLSRVRYMLHSRIFHELSSNKESRTNITTELRESFASWSLGITVDYDFHPCGGRIGIVGSWGPRLRPK